MFAVHLEHFGEDIALILEDGTRISYAKLANESDDIFSRINAPRARTDLIAIECANCLESVKGYLGALRYGCPALLVDADIDLQLRERLYTWYRVSHVFSASGEWRTLQSQGPNVHPDVALLLSTSGSTGNPKLVRLTATNLQANAAAISQYLELNPSERPITTLPIHYSYGLSVLNSHLLVGATILLTSHSTTTRQFWEYFRQHEATSLAGVPMTYSILKSLRFERMTLPSLRTLTQAGGRLDPDIASWYAELTAARGQRFFVMYGQTEATARMAYVPPATLKEKIGSIGIAIPNGKLELINESGHLISDDCITGELQYTGRNVMMGYATNIEDLAAPDTLNGILQTGDLAWRDRDGFFNIVGRLNRFIKVFGNRIGLDEVESQLRAEDYDVAVTGRDDLLLVALRSPLTDKDSFATAIAKRYRLYPSAVKVASVKSFPVSSSGKIQYGELMKSILS